MIRGIRALARKIRGKQLPAEITPEKAAQLRVLISYPEWRVFQRLLEYQVELHAETMLTTSDAAQMQYLRGVIVGLRESTLYAERLATQQAYVPKERAAARVARRAAALYATSAWHAEGNIR